MPRKLRSKPRLDYWKLHRCGQHTSKDSSDSESGNSSNQLLTSSLPPSSEPEESSTLLTSTGVEDISRRISSLNISGEMARELADLQDELAVLEEDIGDYLEENPIIGDVLSTDDLDDNIVRAENFRTNYRKLHLQVERFVERNDEQTTKYERTLTRLKEFIGDAKNQKSLLRQKEVTISQIVNERKMQEERNQMDQSFATSKFLLEEISSLSREIYDEFNKEKEDVSDDEIMRRRSQFPATMKQMEQLSTKIQKILATIPATYPDRAKILTRIEDDYNIINDEKKSYENHFKNEFIKRELMKTETFERSKLNIRLTKFGGFNSELDIYSFQTEFEKLHLKGTPSSVLADLLKNNYLEDQALILAKNVESIDEIWSRLKMAFGDTRIILKKRIDDLSQVTPMWKMKGDRYTEALMKVINLMMDLMQLAKRHKLENHLYFGEAINHLYTILGAI